MDFKEVILRKDLHIAGLFSIHYFEFPRDYAFVGEQHDFWELVYVDKGQLLATAGDSVFPICNGELLLHAPNQWHNLQADGTSAANAMVLSFRCRSKKLQCLADRRFRPDSRQRELLQEILKESRNAFSHQPGNPYDHSLPRRKDTPVGAEQLIGLYLEQLLLSLLRQLESPQRVDRRSGSVPMLDAILSYMERNVTRKLTLEHLSEEFHVSISYIKRLFSLYKQTGAMGYFTELKMQKARQLLRESDRNVSQIAEDLGYDNVYYFCNVFRKNVHMSPLEYRRSVNALTAPPKD